MNPKILLVGTSAEGSEEIKNLLSLNNQYTVTLVTSINGAVAKLARDTYGLVIFDHEILTMDKFLVAKKIRGLGYSLPILLLAKGVVNQVRDNIKTVAKSVILEKPLEHKHFYGVTSKLLAGREVPHQTHKRFYTNQVTVVEQMGKNMKFEGAMLNLSKGGAYLELADKGAASLSGIIKMKVSLNEMDKHYEVNARVVWNSKGSIWGKGSGVGVEFIQAKDVYRNLLNNL